MLALTLAQRDTILFVLFLLATAIMINCAIRLICATRASRRWKRNQKKKIDEWSKEHGFGIPGSSKK